MGSKTKSKWGIWSTGSNKFVFGIIQKTKSAALRTLKERIGKDAYKWRFEARRYPQDQVPHPKLKQKYRNDHGNK